VIWLVDLPFSSIYRPPIGLVMVRSVLRAAGFGCRIEYGNLEFAESIGVPLYQLIAEQLPHDLLIGDRIFRSDDTTPGLSGRCSYADGGPGRFGEVPAWLWDALPGLRAQANEFTEMLASRLVAQKPTFVGLSATFQLLPSLRLAAAIKRRSPETPIVLGGGHCDAEMGLAIHQLFSQVDFVCRGEGEEVVVDLARALTTHDTEALTRTTGLVFRRGTTSVPVGVRAVNINPLDKLPVPDYTDWVERVTGSSLMLPKSELSIPLETSRGCWYGERAHCTFCGLNGSSLVFRSKSSDRVLKEIQALAEYGVPNIDAIDLILDHGYFEDVLPTLAEMNLGVSLFYEVKSNLTRNQVRTLSDAGVRTIQPGIESLNSSVLRLMRKGVAAHQNIRLLKWCMEQGVSPEWNILYGFPGEDPEAYVRMAGMVPLLTHLRPPTVGCNRVLLNRFSPLFFDAARLGVRNIRPVAAYEAAYGISSEVSAGFAYYFDFDFEDHRNPETYIGPLKRAVLEWQAMVGEAILCSYSVQDSIHIFDSRPCATASSHLLTGAEAAVYRALDAGVSPSRLASVSGVDDPVARRIAGQFLESRLVLDVDDKLLALPVALDGWLPPGLPAALIESMCSIVYTRLARSVWQLSNRQTSLPDADTLGVVQPRASAGQPRAPLQ
jgi:ribosomal peptide maturation radical SAM protein 1